MIQVFDPFPYSITWLPLLCPLGPCPTSFPSRESKWVLLTTIVKKQSMTPQRLLYDLYGMVHCNSVFSFIYWRRDGLQLSKVQPGSNPVSWSTVRHRLLRWLPSFFFPSFLFVSLFPFYFFILSWSIAGKEILQSSWETMSINTRCPSALVSCVQVP